MANLLDYLDWRGDLTLAQAPFNEVDNLILAELSFVNFGGIVPPPAGGKGVSLKRAAEAFFARFSADEPIEMGVLVPDAIPEMLKKMAASRRFGSMKLTIDSVLEFDPEQLYAAVAVQPPQSTPPETYRSYIRTYQDKLGTHKDELEDFFHMKKKTDLPVEKTAYMTLDGYRRAGKFLTIRELRKPGQKDL